MSKGGSSAPAQTTQTTVNTPDPQVKAAYLTNLDYARDISNQLGPQQFAGFNPQYEAGEQQVMTAAQGGPGMQNLDTATDLTRAAAGYAPMMVGPNQALTQAYYNPYQQDVIDTGLSDLERARQLAVGRTGQQATAARAFGGSRHGVAEALTNQEYGNQAGSMIANLRAQGFQNAQQMAQQAQQLNQGAGLQGAQFRLGAANQLGTQGQQQLAQQYNAGQALMGLGAARQQQAQQQLDADRSLGLQRLNIMQGALGLQPANLGGTSASTSSQPMYQNTGANVLGGALGGASLAGMIPGMSAGMGAAGGALLGLI